MKLKFFIKGIVITIIIAITNFIYTGNNRTNVDWINDFNYENEEVHDMSIGIVNPCPFISVEFDDKKINIEFDTGSTDGISITTAVKGKIDYEVTGKIISANADGTFRGNGESILLKSINVFGEEYVNVKSSLTDWKMYGAIKFNGMIGLEYFRGKVVTLDYRNKKIAISDNPVDYSKLPKEKYIILPLISPSTDKMKDLLFFEGEVNGKNSTIYLDTGSSRSCVDCEDNYVNTVAEVKLGDKKYKFKKLQNDKIAFQEKFNYPLRLAINSDVLKANNFVITIDKIQNILILSQN